MKRSTMIDMLATALATDGLINYSYGGHDMPSTYTEIAEFVLNEIERLGMLPPLRDWGGCSDPDCCPPAQNEWEEE